QHPLPLDVDEAGRTTHKRGGVLDAVFLLDVPENVVRVGNLLPFSALGRQPAVREMQKNVALAVIAPPAACEDVVALPVPRDVGREVADVPHPLLIAPLRAEEGLPGHESNVAREAQHAVGLHLAAGRIVRHLVPEAYAEVVQFERALPAAGPAF